MQKDKNADVLELRELGMSKPRINGDLRFSKTGVQKPHATTDVRYQDNVECELNGSYFTNAVV